MTKMRFALPQALLPSVAKMPPCTMVGAHPRLDIQYECPAIRMLHDFSLQQNMLPSRYTNHRLLAVPLPRAK